MIQLQHKLYVDKNQKKSIILNIIMETKMIKKYVMTFMLLLIACFSYAEETGSYFPPDMSKMIAAMNLKEEETETDKITIFVPKKSYIYSYVEYVDKRNKINEINPNDPQEQLKSLDEEYAFIYRNIKVGLPNGNYLSNIHFEEKGVFVDVDIKNSPPKSLEIGDSNNNYTVAYNYGSGYLYNTTLKINLERGKRDISDKIGLKDKVNLLNEKFSDYLIKNGFKEEKSFFREFSGEKRYIKENILVILKSNISFMNYSLQESYAFVIGIENIHINKRYEEINDKIKEDSFNKEYKDIQNILK